MDHETQDHGNGCLLLSLERNSILAINESAAVLWDSLQTSSRGLTVDELVQVTLRYYGEQDLSQTDVLRDVTSLTNSLLAGGFLTTARIDGTVAFKIRRGVLRSATRSGSKAKAVDDVIMDQSKSVHSVGDVWLALVGFVLFECVKTLLGFGRLLAIVKSFPIGVERKQLSDRTRQVCDGVSRAMLWYPKTIHCLQHSSVVTCLLRLHGIPATMIIGACQRPFYAHAWTEVGETVVNDSQTVREKYPPFVDACP